MQFSVLMPVYKNETPEFLDAALKSNLVEQSLIPDEFVLVCDGPLTDELYSVINEYQTTFRRIFKVHSLEQNVGLGKALNFGVQMCEHEYIARSDSDDICTKDRFQIQMEHLSRHQDIAVLGSEIDEFDDDPTKAHIIKRMPCNDDSFRRMITMRNPINHMTVVFRKSALLRVGSYQHLPILEDYYLWIRMVNNGFKLQNIGKVLVHARIGSGMLERRSNKQCISSWKQLSDYMLKNRMINKWQYARNMTSVSAFVLMPVPLKKIAYRYILRQPDRSGTNEMPVS